jgi:hypothetical protein
MVLLCDILLCGCGRVLTRPTRTPRVQEMSPIPTWQSAGSDTTSTPEYGTPILTETPVPTSVSGSALRLDQPARVVSGGGLNIRESPSINARRIGQFSPGTLVTVKEGPISADGYRWWRVADKAGLEGWVADGSPGEIWLSPDIGAPRLVNRAVQKDDQVEVAALPSLTLRRRGTLPSERWPSSVRWSALVAPGG